MTYLLSFIAGLIIGSFAYSLGYRAQSPIQFPFYKKN